MNSKSCTHDIALSRNGPLVMRWAMLSALLVAELAVITTAYAAPTIFSPLLTADFGWAVRLFRLSKYFWQEGLWVAGACFLVLIPRRREIIGKLVATSGKYGWWSWLLLHLVTFCAFASVTALVYGRPTDPARLTTLWALSWLGLAGMVFASWVISFAPVRFWCLLVREHGPALSIGILLGVVAALINRMLIRQEAPLAQKELWDSLSVPTLWSVRSLLGWIYPEVIFDPEKAVVGTPSFSVEVTYACSGIEGIALITAFLAIYLWLFRSSLRFPRAFWLFPLGVAASWLANVLRITGLVSIGSTFSPEVALQGFHENAGWAAFTLIALTAIAMTHRMRFFAAMSPASGVAANGSRSPAAALLAPLMVQMGALMATSLFSQGFDLLYPLRILAVAGALYYFRRSYRGLVGTWSWYAVAMGTLVFGIWVALEPPAKDAGVALVKGLTELPSWAAALWLASRVLGSVFVVPLAEELAFRGYMLRKLVAEDYELVSFRRFTWYSFLLSSVAFGLLHGERWVAGTLAGMGFAAVVYFRGRLGDAVAAHMTSNALISVWVLARGTWHLWS